MKSSNILYQSTKYRCFLLFLTSFRFPKISKSNQLGYEMAFRRSEPLHDMKFNEVRKAHLQSVIDNCDKS